MHLSRVQFTVRRMMITIALAALLLAIVIHRHRRIQRLDRMVINQQITMSSAEANLANAVLACEAAEDSLRQQTEKYSGPGAEVLRNDGAQATASAHQSPLLATYDTEQANAEQRFARILQQLDEGTYAAALVTPTAAQTVIRLYGETLENHVAATQASQLAGAQGPREKTRIIIEGIIEKTRGQERIKRMILDYEKAYLKNLKRERANMWW
jgi:hypothetical protein